MNVAAQVRFFPQDNFKLAPKVAYEHRTLGYVYSSARLKADSWLAGASAEYRLGKFSFTADVDQRWVNLNTNYGYSTDYRDFRAMVGVKVNFGSKTLVERNRSGASLDPVRALFPNVLSIENGYGGE